jgi:hypothetical protein
MAFVVSLVATGSLITAGLISPQLPQRLKQQIITFLYWLFQLKDHMLISNFTFKTIFVKLKIFFMEDLKKTLEIEYTNNIYLQ